MIKANELRKGIVLNIFKPEVAGFNPVVIDTPRLIALLTGEETTYYPIPLTPEILQACGFSISPTAPFNDQTAYVIGQDSGALYWCAGDMFKKTPNGFIYLTSRDYIKGNPAIQHLHQLQNLYHSLTGHELEIKILTT